MKKLVLLIIPALLMGILLYTISYAYKDIATERDRLIAALMYNFLRYTDYKIPALEKAPYISICIIGSDTLFNEFKSITGRSHQGKIIELRRIEGKQEIARCHQLFIGDTERQAELIKKATSLGILTFSDKQGFLKNGGIVEFFIKQNKMRFHINIRAMKDSNIQLSSRVLELSEGQEN